MIRDDRRMGVSMIYVTEKTEYGLKMNELKKSQIEEKSIYIPYIKTTTDSR